MLICNTISSSFTPFSQWTVSVIIHMINRGLFHRYHERVGSPLIRVTIQTQRAGWKYKMIVDLGVEQRTPPPNPKPSMPSTTPLFHPNVFWGNLQAEKYRAWKIVWIFSVTLHIRKWDNDFTKVITLKAILRGPVDSPYNLPLAFWDNFSWYPFLF